MPSPAWHLLNLPFARFPRRKRPVQISYLSSMGLVAWPSQLLLLPLLFLLALPLSSSLPKTPALLPCQPLWRDCLAPALPSAIVTFAPSWGMSHPGHVPLVPAAPTLAGLGDGGTQVERAAVLAASWWQRCHGLSALSPARRLRHQYPLLGLPLPDAHP